MASSVNQDEVARFAALADQWWSERGPYAPLHKLTPVRVEYVRDRILEHYGEEPKTLKALSGFTILDVGCGGGVLAEPLARLGAHVTAIDPAEENIAAARHHAEEAGLTINYRAATAEQLFAEGQKYQAVIASEVIEHVNDPAQFVKTLAGLVSDEGILLVSTLNRTLKSFALAIVGAEYVLRWIPAGTHDWQKFVTPEELTDYCNAAGLDTSDVTGMIFDPLQGRWRLGRDSGCNYWLTAEK